MNTKELEARVNVILEPFKQDKEIVREAASDIVTVIRMKSRCKKLGLKLLENNVTREDIKNLIEALETTIEELTMVATATEMETTDSLKAQLKALFELTSIDTVEEVN